MPGAFGGGVAQHALSFMACRLRGMWVYIGNGMKTIYIRNILSELWRRRLWVAIFVAVCAAAGVFFALRPGTSVNLTDEQEEELAEYNGQLEGYDAAISDLEDSIRENVRQVDELRDYIDNSIYMQIDPANVQTATVQYGLQTLGNVGNILNSFITYINDGGLRESVDEADQDLKPEYWRDVVSCYINSNILSVTVVHYDAAQCARIMDIVKRRIMEHVPEVKAVQGDFTLTELESTQFVKADAGIVNGQNGHWNNLKGYESGLADLRSRLVGYRANKANYIEDNEPEFAYLKEDENPNFKIFGYALAGIVIGAAAAFAAVALRYIMSDRLRSADDLQDSGLNVLGICRMRVMSDAAGKQAGEAGMAAGHMAFCPELARTVQDIRVLANAGKNNGHSFHIEGTGAEGVSATRVFLDMLHDDAPCREAADAYQAAMADAGIESETGADVMESAKDLEKMVGSACSLLIAEAGKTTYKQLKQRMELCARFQVAILGCVVVE